MTDISLLLDDVGDGIILTDFDERVTYINKAARRILAYDGEIAADTRFLDVCPLVNLKTMVPFKSPLRRVMDEECTGGLERDVGLIRPDGTSVYISATCSPVHTPGKTVSGCSVILRDISHLRRLEMKIESDHLYMRTVFGVAQVGLCVLDSTGAVIELNESALRIMHTTSEKAIGLQFGDAFHCENSLVKGCGHSKDCKLCPVRNNIEAAISDDSFTGEFTVAMRSPRSQKAEWLHIFVSQAALGVTEKRIVVSLIDVSEREQRKVELEKARQEAENVSRLKGQFLATISHEIRTPINGMIGMIDLTMRESLTAEQRENLENAKECAADLLLIINDILDYSKIENGRLELENIDFDLHKELKQVTRVHAKVAQSRGLFFKVPQLEDVPRYIMGDPLRFRQILNNLLANALKFTSEGGVSLEANVRNVEGKKFLELGVRDTGIGMNAEQQQKLFKPFSQVDGSITRRFGGTGLGLMIVKELVEAMHGEITVHSVPTCGSLFLCRLPLNEADGSEEGVGRKQSGVLLNPLRSAGKREKKVAAKVSTPSDTDISSLLEYCAAKLKE